MRKKHLLFIFFILFIILIPPSAFASQAEPKFGINEQTKECSEFFMGDECLHPCSIPEGWKLIENFQCPNGYKKIQANSDCTPVKNTFCCTVQHSGASGDCGDVVVNSISKKCAFVKDINNCEKLPSGWKQAEESDFWGRVCPSLDYEWIKEPLNCTEKITDDPKNNQQISNLSLSLLIISGLVLLIIIGWFFIRKRLAR